MSKKLVIGAYANWDDARQAIEELLEKNVASDKISLIAGESAKKYAAEVSQPDKERGNVASGLTKGSVIGGLAGLILGAGALMIPGVGPILAAGPLYGAFVGVVAGSVGGGLIGVFSKWGFAEEDARAYVDLVKNGGIVVAVETEDAEANQISDSLNHHNAFQPAKVSEWHDVDNLNSMPVTKVDVDASGKVTMPKQENPLTTTDPQALAAKAQGVPPIEAMTPAFSEHYQQKLAASGKPLDFFQRAYLQGYDVANDDRYRTQEWDKIEPSLKEYWEQFEPGMWDQVKEAVQFGYEKALQRV